MLLNTELYKAPPTVTKAKSPLDPWRKLLLAGADLIEECGHCKNTIEDEKGALCLVGALSRAGLDGYGEAIARLDRMCGGKGGSAAIDFNNRPETTAWDVIDLMRRAATAS